MKYEYIRWMLVVLSLATVELQAQKPELVVQTGHGGSVNSVAFSPDGKYILTGCNDHTAELWDFNGRKLQSFTGHSDNVTSVAFSPDGRQILTGSWDKTAKLWDFSGRELQSFTGHSAFINSVAFSPDGKQILTGSSEWTAKLWDLNGRELQSFDGHRDVVNSVAFSPDGKQILTGSFDKTAKLWDLGGKEIRNFSGHKHFVNSATFSPDGQYVLTGSVDHTAKLWDLSGHQLKNFIGSSSVESVAFSPDGSKILTGSRDNEVKLWEQNGRELYSYSDHSYPIWSVAFSPNGKQILTGGWTQAKLWNLDERQLKSFIGHSSLVKSVAFSPDGKQILTGSWDNTAKLWDLNGRELESFTGHSDIVTSVAFSPDGKSILTGSSDKTAKLWDLNGQELQSLKGHSREIESVAFSPNGKIILTGSRDKTAKLWDFNGRILQNFMRHNHMVTSVAFSPDGKQILTGSSRYVDLWELLGRNLLRFPGHSLAIESVAFSPNGKQILTGSRDHTAKLWDLNMRELQSFTGHSSSVESVAFSPNGKYILTGSRDRTTKLWDASTGKQLLSFIGIVGEKNSWLITDPDQYYMASKSGTDFIQFKIGLTTFNFDQFDLRLNRPDKIFEPLLSLGIDSSLVIQYRNAYYKRLEKYGFTEEMLADDYHVPECVIQNTNSIPLFTTDSTLQLHIQATDSLRLLDRLNIYVNDVPIYGINGINLRPLTTQTYSTQLDIPLSRGPNKIEVSALNQGGAESLKASTYITYETPDSTSDLYLITIGVSDYQAEGRDLSYAAKDARDIANFYANATGFKQIHSRTLTNDQVTKSNILALRDLLEQSKVDDQVLIYVSGHGLLDSTYDFYFATHDVDFDQPAGKGILYDDIEGLLDGIPARKKLLLMDACHSGEYDADAQPMTQAQQDSLKTKGIAFKGFSKSGDGPVLGLQNSFDMMKQLFADLRRGSGATVISSSSGLQFSYEDPNWQNGAFTYVFLRGLKTMEADENTDGQVTASEIQTYVAEFVPRLTAGMQVPTFRRENLEYDFRVW